LSTHRAAPLRLHHACARARTRQQLLAQVLENVRHIRPVDGTARVELPQPAASGGAAHGHDHDHQQQQQQQQQRGARPAQWQSSSPSPSVSPRGSNGSRRARGSTGADDDADDMSE
jgi:hypothetical protein